MPSIINAVRRCFHRHKTPATVPTVPAAHTGSTRPPAPASAGGSSGENGKVPTRNWAAARSSGWGTRPLEPGERGARPGGMRTAAEMHASENKKKLDKFEKMEKAQLIAREIAVQNVKNVKERLQSDRPAPVGITTEPVRRTTFVAHKQPVVNAFPPPIVIVDTNGSRVHRHPRTSRVPEPPSVKTSLSGSPLATIHEESEPTAR